jgi:hypothetical protein
MWRDRHYRDPLCEAPVRHIDHIQRYTDNGLTIDPNGRGECERGNYVCEMPGRKVESVTSGLDGAHHTIKITTPTRPQLPEPSAVEEEEEEEEDMLRPDERWSARFAGFSAANRIRPWSAAWTSRLANDQRQAFVEDVLDEYAEVSGSDSLFAFLQFTVALTAANDH